eukprot:TRINITY_DN9386_c0_g1_i1.p1 TRINITY_DN9386_c0_g1~~TRINITY_DN9386_c0_g1_i1.p1  ORF type:complete len:959 (+),score=296.49 TRINITY_DN9386_c0_g1_i1:363-2879(+)
MVDRKIDQRRKARREMKLRQELETFKATAPKIQEQFSGIKEQLATVTAAEWGAIPDLAENKTRTKRKPERYVPVPDNIIDSVRSEAETTTYANDWGGDTPLPGTVSTFGGRSGAMSVVSQDLTQIGQARQKVLDSKLNSMADSVSGQTVVDPKGYLTDMKSMKINTDAEIGDIKRARLLLKSVTSSNPHHAPGWIAAARLEEVAGKVTAARKIIDEGCQLCPENEDVWIEAARLHPSESASIFARAVKNVPHSVKIWSAAANIETDLKLKKRVLRRGIEFNPSSLKLWKSAIELEEPDEAKILLSRAVECVPHSKEMWLALAHLETYENAKKVLNKAREMLPTEISIWISATKLEEAHGAQADLLAKIINRAVKSLSSHQVVITRDHWLKEAENCEMCGSLGTCTAIVKETISLGLDDEDKKSTWMEDSESCISRSLFHTARSILNYATTCVPSKKSLWIALARLEKMHGTKEELETVLRNSVKSCPGAEILWLMYAKEAWTNDRLTDARNILKEAFVYNANSEKIWLAAVKLESSNNEYDRARLLLNKAREHSGTERIWRKSAVLERQLEDFDAERKLLVEALEKFPRSPKLWRLRAQLEETVVIRSTPMEGGKDPAREIYNKCLELCPNSTMLWICAARWEEKRSSANRARSLLERARLKNPKTPELWLAAIRVELRSGNSKSASALLAKALQENPKSGVLWAQSIAMEIPAKQKAKVVDALKRVDNDPYVIICVAKIFWDDRKTDKARSWFERAVTIDSDLGDAWALYYKFERNPCKAAHQQRLIKNCPEAAPRNGEVWNYVAKMKENYKRPPSEIMKKVAAVINDETTLLGPPL